MFSSRQSFVIIIIIIIIREFSRIESVCDGRHAEDTGAFCYDFSKHHAQWHRPVLPRVSRPRQVVANQPYMTIGDLMIEKAGGGVNNRSQRIR